MNHVVLYFAQAPDNQPEIPGPFRMAEIPVVYNPPHSRSPDDAILEVFDDEFIHPIIRLE